ncbi:MAG: TcaA 3rd/4th domain-containing protein, partial [Bacillota bacterium]
METAKVSKKRKISLVILALFLIIGIAVTSYVYFSRPSGEEVVNQFEAAVNQGDIDTLEGLIKANKDMKLTKQNLEQLVAYAKDEPSYLKESVFIMKAQAAIKEKDKDAKSQNPIFEVATEGEILNAGDYYIAKEDGLFSSYKIHPRPYSLTVTADQADSIIKVNNKEVLTTKESNLEATLKNLPPGTYTVSGTKEYEFAKLDTSEEVNLFDESKREKSVSLDLTGEKISIESSVEGISVFVNGKDTGKKAAVTEEGLFGTKKDDAALFGPFSTDGSIEVHGEATFPWGVAKSEAQKIQEDTRSLDVTPDPFADSKIKDQVVNTINTFAKQHIESFVKQDAGVITTATDSIIKEHANDIQFDKSNEHYWKGEALGTKIDIEKATLSTVEDQHQVIIPVEFHYNQKEYIKGFTDNEPLEEVIESASVVLTYNDQSTQWLVSEIQSDYFNSGEFNGKDVIQ